jgi:hypothetical protein
LRAVEAARAAQAPSLDELVVTDTADAWRRAGFHVRGDGCEVGGVRIRLAGPGGARGIVAWSVRGAASLDLDGLRTTASERAPAQGGQHPNGVVAIDHLVLMTPDLDRTTGVLRAAGLDLRRMREGATPGGSLRQAFFRMGELILEVVAAPAGLSVAADPQGPARLWGISFLVPDMQATASRLGELLGPPRAAVQAGRTIATLRREAGIGTAVAFITPGPGAA